MDTNLVSVFVYGKIMPKREFIQATRHLFNTPREESKEITQCETVFMNNLLRFMDRWYLDISDGDYDYDLNYYPEVYDRFENLYVARAGYNEHDGSFVAVGVFLGFTSSEGIVENYRLPDLQESTRDVQFADIVALCPGLQCDNPCVNVVQIGYP